VVAPVKNEPDFERLFHRELYQTPNIQTLGWLDLCGPAFRSLVRECAAVVMPSASEAQSGAIHVGMHAGLIPVATRETDAEIDACGVRIADMTVESVIRAVRAVAGLPIHELKARSRQSWEHVHDTHTRENYARVYRSVIEQILANHQPGRSIVASPAVADHVQMIAADAH
jgi:hypothetical protein